MTDYSSQGKTRPFNPVHLDYCKSHQACYTALSRTATAKGTILLQPISPTKVQGGIHGSLRQEFRELELLDEITRLCYERCLPITVRGDRRYVLLDAYHKTKGAYYVPATVHPAIVWSRALPFEPSMVKDIPWKILTKSKKSNTNAKCKARTSDVVPSAIPIAYSVSTKKGRIVSRSAFHPEDASANPYGTSRSNNSCAYDAFFAVIFNVWHSDMVRFKIGFHEMSPQYLGKLSESFDLHILGTYNL
ncbi:hypothetical protein ARMSODRAFT_900599, partial [Armillaria solidipes]